MKKVLALLVSVLLLLAMIPMTATSVSAASTSQYAPYSQIEYGYTASVSCGTVRYMSQIVGSSYFYDAYWGNWKSQAGIECGTCSISMSLSYIGINKTPKEILDYGGGVTYFGYDWGGAQVKSYSSTNLSTAIDNYVNGSGQYSPPIIHLNNYSTAGHYVVLVGKISSNQYQVLDPANSSFWSITINGSSAQYKHPSSGATISDSIDMSGRTDDIYQWYNSDASITPELITEKYNSHCNIMITSDNAYVKSMPCSKDTDPDSVDVEKAHKGDVYEAMMLCKNKWGLLWYQVKARNGKTGYVYAGDTKFIDQRLDDVWVKNPISPTNIKKGNSFSIGGTIYSTCQTITRVQSWVSNTNDTVDYLYGHADNLFTGSYNLAGSAVDSMLKFDSLDVGTYKYVVRVRVDSYYAADDKTVAATYYDELYLDECESIFTVTSSSCSHSYDITVKNPSCTEDGYSTYVCKYCGAQHNSDYVEATGHYYETVVTKPTCTRQGFTEHCCQWCEDYYKDSYVDPLGHSYKGWITAEATCGKDGVMTYTCSSCGDSYTEVIPATGDHTYDDDYDAACNVCGDIREVPEKPPVTPDLPADAPAFVVESTTAREGEEFTVAVRTERNSGIVSFKLNVSYDADLLELVGYEEKDFSSMSFGPETNNPFVINWVDAVRPDNTTNGVVVLLTFRVKEGVPVGNTAITLSYNADDVYDQNFENVGFRVENGTVEIVEYTPGDVNGDSKINNKDLGLLQQYLNGWTVTVSEKAADANGDGKVNNKDLGLLQQYLNGWNVELG